MHRISPGIIKFSGDKVVCESFGDITARFTAVSNGYEYDLVSTARFVSRLEKFQGSWYMLSLEVIYMHDYIFPVGASPKPDYSTVVDWPRSSYKFVAWHLIDMDVKAEIDLPGEDETQSAREVLDRNYGWLSQ
jgi:hypothetical protein